MKAKKKREFDLVGVRFTENPANIFTYRVRKDSVTRGQQLVVENHKGTNVVIVVQINATTMSELADRGVIDIKWIRQKVVPL